MLFDEAADSLDFGVVSRRAFYHQLTVPLHHMYCTNTVYRLSDNTPQDN